MDTKSTNSNIDKLENSIIELKAMVNEFIEKKRQRFKGFNFFNKKNENNDNKNTIDDIDLTSNPVLIDKLDIQEIRTRINSLETKMNLFIENLENKNEKNKEEYETLKNMVVDIRQEIRKEQTEMVDKFDRLEKSVEHGVIMYD
jgi:hypothetical protein